MSTGCSYWQIYVKCPFYRRDDGKANIVCEGCGESRSVVLLYRYKSELLKQLQLFCCEHYQKCEIYRAIMEKYEE